MNNKELIFSEGDLLRLTLDEYCDVIQNHYDFNYEHQDMLLLDRYISVLRYIKNLTAEREYLEKQNFYKESK